MSSINEWARRPGAAPSCRLYHTFQLATRCEVRSVEINLFRLPDALGPFALLTGDLVNRIDLLFACVVTWLCPVVVLHALLSL